MLHLRVAILPWLVLAALLAHAREAAAECPKAKGKPIYRVTRGPVHKPPKGEKPQTQVFSVFATGRWTWVGPSATEAGQDDARGGCIAPAAMKELQRALAKARFRVAGGVVTTCAALPIARVKYAALRSGKRVTTEEPCGIPLDKSTAALARCAEEAARTTPPPLDELRKICRGES
ncbi:MAG: hypothetical protein K8M05_19430 [Deltaproteobacteria bacterium]|nr:hypothetical protein [Kofleriaceae bacterium]